MIAYGFSVTNKEVPTRLVGTSKTLVDYIITDHLIAETFETHVSDSPYRTTKNKPIDNRAALIIRDFQLNTNRKDLFCRDLESSD